MLTVFSIKPLFTDSDGTSIRDLTYPSIRYNYDPRIEGAVAVSDQLAMRPDLISKAGYGTPDMWDMILKYNNISNPFSVGPGDVLAIPYLDDMKEQLAPDATQDVLAESTRKQYIDVSKKAKSDPRVAAAELKRRAAQRSNASTSGVQSVSNLPPNIAEAGDREIVIKGGKIYFGPDISKGKQACETPLTKSEFVANLIKNRLKNG